MNTKIIEQTLLLFLCLFATIALNGQITIDYPESITIECGTDLVPDENNEVLGYPDVSTLCNSGGLEVSYMDNSNGLTECGGTGVLLRFWTAKDNCGGLMTLLQEITIADTTPPEINCLPDRSIECDAPLNPEDNPDLGFPSTLDCASETEVTLTYTDENVGAGICDNQPEQILRTWTATDACGNTATCQQTIRVGIEALIVFCEPQDFIQECNGLEGSIATAEFWDISHVTQLTNCATSECGGIEVISDFDFGRISDECGVTGSFEVNYLIKDACGNSKFKSAMFTLRDTTPPQAFCDPLDFEINCEGDETAASRVASWHQENLGFLQNCLFDNCGNVTVSSDFDTASFDINNINFDCTDTVGIAVNYILTDECGNTAIKKAALKVVDSSPPHFEGVASDTSVGPGQTAPLTTPTVLDNCSSNLSAEFSENRVDNPNDEGYTLVRTWTATDICGNVGTTSQRVMVLDPVLALACTSTEVQVSDDQIVISNLQAPNEIVKVFNINKAIVYNCFRNCGEVQTTRPLPEGVYEVDVEYYTATWQFICDAIIPITIGAADDCANPNCETTAPVFTVVPADITVDCAAVPPPASPSATDNCDDNVTITLEESGNGDCTSDYFITRTWTATDDCGNITTAQQIVNVIANNNSNCGTNPCETTPPVLNNIPSNVTVNCDEIPNVPVNITATDNCDTNVEIAFEESQTAGSCAEGYAITRTWTAIDDCENTDIREQIIQVLGDNTLPFDTIPDNACAAIEISIGTNSFDFFNLNAPNKIVKVFDENYIVVLQCEGDCGTELSFSYEIPGTYFADVQLYTADWVFICETRETLVLQNGSENCGANPCELTPPVLSGIPTDISVNCDEIPSLPDNISASDNCDTNVEITFEESQTAGSCAEGYIITRTWTAIDDCENTHSLQQIITVKGEGNADAEACSNVQITEAQNGILFTNLSMTNSIIKVFSEDYQILFECFANCEEMVIAPVNGFGIYHTDVQFYTNDWQFLCEDKRDISISPDSPADICELANCPTDTTTNPNPACTDIEISATSNQISITGLTAPNEILKVFNENYDLLYECIGNCTQSIAVVNLATGNYQVNINFYNEDWMPICELIEPISLNANLSDPNPAEPAFLALRIPMDKFLYFQILRLMKSHSL